TQPGAEPVQFSLPADPAAGMEPGLRRPAWCPRRRGTGHPAAAAGPAGARHRHGQCPCSRLGLLRGQHLLHSGRTRRHRPGTRAVRRPGGGHQLRPVLLRPALHPLALSVRPQEGRGSLMRLVLLPGLNGGSALFAPLLAELGDIDCQVLELPEHGPQDYDALAHKIAERLPSTPFVLLGESFSGPVAYRLAMRKPPGLQGVIFAASFLIAPSAALPLLKRLPISLRLATQPWLLRAMCLGQNASDQTLQLVQKEIRGLDKALIRARLHTLATLQAPLQRLDLPALHLWPQRDR